MAAPVRCAAREPASAPLIDTHFFFAKSSFCVDVQVNLNPGRVDVLPALDLPAFALAEAAGLPLAGVDAAGDGVIGTAFLIGATMGSIGAALGAPGAASTTGKFGSVAATVWNTPPAGRIGAGLAVCCAVKLPKFQPWRLELDVARS